MSNKENVLFALLSTEQVVTKQVPMKRFLDKEGNAVEFTIQALDGAEIDRLEEQCIFYRGKGNKKEKVRDDQKFNALIIKQGCVVPNWNDQQLKDMYKTSDAVDVIKQRLLAGEAAKLSMEILELSGFGDDEDEAIEEAKN